MYLRLCFGTILYQNSVWLRLTSEHAGLRPPPEPHSGPSPAADALDFGDVGEQVVVLGAGHGATQVLAALELLHQQA